MTSKAPTLADSLIRESFRPEWKKHIDPHNRMRPLLLEARKFVLDDSMSAFMADLAYASLLTTNNPTKANILLDGMRSMARLPHKITWIEFNSNAKMTRARDEYGAKVNPDLAPEKCGWLLQQHPQLDTAFMALECASHSYDLNGQGRVGTPQPFIFSYAWRSDEGAPPWPKLKLNTIDTVLLPVPAFLTGVSTYRTDSLHLVDSGIYPKTLLDTYLKKSSLNPLQELASDARYLWALLATINQLPVSRSDIVASKGYVARGRYRKFLNHTVIKLTIPTERFKRVAAQSMVIIRRRAHQVRGHWRKDYRHPGGRLWIKEHQRGDASLGFVTHDYEVSREKEKDNGLLHQPS